MSTLAWLIPISFIFTEVHLISVTTTQNLIYHSIGDRKETVEHESSVQFGALAIPISPLLSALYL